VSRARSSRAPPRACRVDPPRLSRRAATAFPGALTRQRVAPASGNAGKRLGGEAACGELRGKGHQHRAVTPRPLPAHAGLVETLHDLGMRHAEAPRTRRRRDRQTRRDGGEQRSDARRAAPMMRELEHVASKRGAGRDEALLCRRLDIAGQQQARIPDLHAHHQRAVVGAFGRRIGRRPERRHAEISDLKRRAAGPDLLHGHGP